MSNINKKTMAVVLSGLLTTSAVLAVCQRCTEMSVEGTYIGSGGFYCVVIYENVPTCAPSSWWHKCVFPEPQTYVTVTGTISGPCSISGTVTQDFANCDTLVFSCGS